MRHPIHFSAAIILLGVSAASAQEAPAPEPVTLEAALQALPDHTRYRVELKPSDMPRDELQSLAQMIGDAARGQHFYGAVYAYRPADGGRTEVSMRSGLHSREAARRGASADCEAARSEGDAPCGLIGEILPENWSDVMPQLSHVAVQALRETAGEVPGNVAVARSHDGDGFEIRAGDDVRAATLDYCNEQNESAGLPKDCEIVIDDLAR